MPVKVMVEVKKGWVGAGSVAELLGPPIIVGGMRWSPVLFEYEDYPEFFKTDGLEGAEVGAAYATDVSALKEVNALLLEALKGAQGGSCIGTDENNDTCGVTFTCGPCRRNAKIAAAIAKAQAAESHQ